MKIGVIGDDFTGSGDIANTLAKAGARTVHENLAHGNIDAAVIALKTRSILANDAVAQSLAAAAGWLPMERSKSSSNCLHRKAISARWRKRC